ncbi:MAG: hypothetical protein Q8J74_00560, partial [Candidatus Didemnitutus sp.]|nr:hypothetical protein [Candidatus Didemnitutus sp.]
MIEKGQMVSVGLWRQLGILGKVIAFSFENPEIKLQPITRCTSRVIFYFRNPRRSEARHMILEHYNLSNSRGADARSEIKQTGVRNGRKRSAHRSYGKDKIRAVRVAMNRSVSSFRPTSQKLTIAAAHPEETVV